MLAWFLGVLFWIDISRKGGDLSAAIWYTISWLFLLFWSLAASIRDRRCLVIALTLGLIALLEIQAPRVREVVGGYAKLWIEEEQYLEQLAMMRPGEEHVWGDISVEEGPPRLVGFAWLRGWNWSGVVHDPSQTLGDRRGQFMFGSRLQLVWVYHLRGPWYQCLLMS